jgi:hypothetical protein
MLTTHFQQELLKPQLNIAFFGSHFLHDVALVGELSERLANEGSTARWFPIMCVEEFRLFDESYQCRSSPKFGLIPLSEVWGDSLFFDSVQPVRDTFTEQGLPPAAILN